MEEHASSVEETVRSQLASTSGLTGNLRDGESAMTSATTLGAWPRRLAIGLAGAVAAVLMAPGTAAIAAPAGDSSTETNTWQVAPAGACARADARDPCSEGQCSSDRAPVRSRFDAADVASVGLERERGGAAPPEPIAFGGPGPCADPSTPCGQTPVGRVASGGSSPGPPPTGVIEQPGTPGTLPGTLPGLP